MRVLIVGAVPSHLMPMVPLAWALRAMGHEVVVVGRAEVVRTAREAGMCTIAIEPADLGADQRRRAGQAPGGSGGPPSWDDLADNWRARVGNVIDAHLGAARAFAPDLVVTDPIEYAGPVVAGVLGVPYVVHRWGPESLTSEALPHARAALRALCARVGMVGPFDEPAAIVDPCPPSLQAPEATPASHPTRFVPYNGPGPRPVWDRPEGHRICLSLGLFGFTVVTGGDGPRPPLRRLADELAGREDLDVVLPTPAAHADEVRDLPPPLRPVEQLPLSAMLDGCALVLHHGGSGTALTAAAFGLPQLVLRQEHPALAACADRVVHRGVAQVVGPEGAGAAIDALLAGGPPVDAARRLQAEMAGLPTPAQTASALAGLVSARPRRPMRSSREAVAG